MNTMYPGSRTLAYDRMRKIAIDDLKSLARILYHLGIVKIDLKILDYEKERFRAISSFRFYNPLTYLYLILILVFVLCAHIVAGLFDGAQEFIDHLKPQDETFDGI